VTAPPPREIRTAKPRSPAPQKLEAAPPVHASAPSTTPAPQPAAAPAPSSSEELYETR
jgi:hypothetical protein